ncbi:hypothetical protein [Ulvibacter antarcticus]|uniref:Uncharacterized protein n=1 Tax=Ulvibacter antarcticus TaxID=442714 RepID=A0A3L9YBA5_9FLAO|nr:hypothetical protein [Ulvibacter antarcticus]RMA56757.1 hypothetical protein BXY75_3274 [Ulvibacter antarcticus]
MKILAPFFVLLLISSTIYSQVGINTTEPTSTLDVAGTIRMRGMEPNDGEVIGETPLLATKILGLDDLGNFIEVEIDENVILKNNKISAIDRVVEIGSAPTFVLPVVSDIAMLILPGEPNEDYKVIRLNSIWPTMTMTGLLAGVDGQTIWLYPQTSDLIILRNSLLSLLGNRIEGSGNVLVEQYEMVQLMYDGVRGKWIIMQQ